MVTGVLLVAGATVGLATSVVVFNAWRIALFAGAYEEAVFVVERVEYVTLGSNKQRQEVPTAWGTIGAAEEEISLRGFGFEAETTEALQAEFPAGAEIEVCYDAGAADVYTPGRTLKVLPASTSFALAWMKAVGVRCCVSGRLWPG